MRTFLSVLPLSRAAVLCGMRALRTLPKNRRRSDGGKRRALGVPRRRRGISNGLRPSLMPDVLLPGLTWMISISAKARQVRRPSRIVLMKGDSAAEGGMVEGAGVAETPLTGTGVQVVLCLLVLRRSLG